MSQTDKVGVRWLKSGKITLQFGEITSSKGKFKWKQQAKSPLLGVKSETGKEVWAIAKKKNSQNLDLKKSGRKRP